MGVKLLKVTNIGLKITDALTVPIIKCVISTDSDNEHLTAAEFNSLKYEIYSRAGGMVSVSGFWTRSNNVPPFSENIGDYSYGINSSTGGYYIQGRNNVIEKIATSAQVIKINFNGKQISYPYSDTGYSAWETAHGFILVDKNNQLYSCGHCRLYVLYDVNPGITSIDNKIPAAEVISGYSLRDESWEANIRATGHDITGDITKEIDPDVTDPYASGGESGTGGGTGNFDGTGDDIDIPELPTISAVDTGFITLFNPSAGELRNLANYMWSDLFDLDTWKKIFADPMDAILGLSIVPVEVPNGGSRAVTVGNISTGVSMNTAAQQYVAVDCGTLNVNEYWGAYLDYDPFTKAEIYLPYIGIHPLAVDDIMNKSVHVVYHIDILSGACCAYVKCGGSVLYSFVGQCSCSIPITGNDWTNVVNGALSIAASIGTMVATGGASAPLAASDIASTAVNSMKPNVEKSGSMGGMGGMLGVQTPYIILTRPRQALPKNQNKYSGYPSFITRKLSAVSGYTEIESVHLDGIPATEQELSEIESLLKGGVIL